MKHIYILILFTTFSNSLFSQNKELESLENRQLIMNNVLIDSDNLFISIINCTYNSTIYNPPEGSNVISNIFYKLKKDLSLQWQYEITNSYNRGFIKNTNAFFELNNNLIIPYLKYEGVNICGLDTNIVKENFSVNVLILDSNGKKLNDNKINSCVDRNNITSCVIDDNLFLVYNQNSTSRLSHFKVINNNLLFILDTTFNNKITKISKYKDELHILYSNDQNILINNFDYVNQVITKYTEIKSDKYLEVLDYKSNSNNEFIISNNKVIVLDSERKSHEILFENGIRIFNTYTKPNSENLLVSAYSRDSLNNIKNVKFEVVNTDIVEKINDYSNNNGLNFYFEKFVIKNFNLFKNNESKSTIIIEKINSPHINNNFYYAYPNPSNNSLFIKNIEENENIFIFDLLGKILIETQYKNRIDISELENGLYLVKIGNNLLKFIKI